MPNEILINHLDSLRETYLQQQKTTAALQKTFKTFIDTQSKALKTLRDSGTQNIAIDVMNALNAFAQLRLKEDTIDPLLPELRHELKTLAALVGALREGSSALRSEPVDVVHLDKALKVLQSAPRQEILDLIPELRKELELAQHVLGDEFGAKLRDALAEQGILIGGRAPKFEIGRFELEANFAGRFIILRYGRDVVVPRATITVEATLKAFQYAAKFVEGRNQDGKAWIGQFYEAYQRAQRKQAVDGPRVNIVDCYFELVLLRQGRAFSSEPSKHTFTEYSRAQFNYDFYEFANRQRLANNRQVVKAHSATKSQTDSPARSMWIVEGDTPYDGRYIADVEFGKE